MNTERIVLMTLGAFTHAAVLVLILGSAFLPEVPLDWQALLALIALEGALLKIDIENPFGGGGNNGSSGGGR